MFSTLNASNDWALSIGGYEWKWCFSCTVFRQVALHLYLSVRRHGARPLRSVREFGASRLVGAKKRRAAYLLIIVIIITCFFFGARFFPLFCFTRQKPLLCECV